MTDVSVARAWAPRTTAFRARHMTDGAVQSTQATALYKIATKGLATLRIITNQETLVRYKDNTFVLYLVSYCILICQKVKIVTAMQ